MHCNEVKFCNESDLFILFLFKCLFFIFLLIIYVMIMIQRIVITWSWAWQQAGSLKKIQNFFDLVFKSSIKINFCKNWIIFLPAGWPWPVGLHQLSFRLLYKWPEGRHGEWSRGRGNSTTNYWEGEPYLPLTAHNTTCGFHLSLLMSVWDRFWNLG